MTVKFFPNDKGNPPGKLADAELHFSGGPARRPEARGLRGLGAQERRTQRDVPGAAVLGQRRAPQLRAAAARSSTRQSQDRLRDVILDAYKEHEAALAEAVLGAAARPRECAQPSASISASAVAPALPLRRQRPLGAGALLELLAEERGLEAAVDDLPRQERVGAAVAIEVRRRVEAGVGDGRAPVAAVALRRAR